MSLIPNSYKRRKQSGIEKTSLTRILWYLFCGLGADNALEHVNRALKVIGALVGISLKTTAHYLLIFPELAHLAEEEKSMAGVSRKVQDKSHNLTAAVTSRCHQPSQATPIDPFTQSSDELFNLITKVVVPDNVKLDLYTQRTEGDEILSTFIAEHIQRGAVSLWAQIKKGKLLTWKSTGKKGKITVNDTIIELKEDRSLFSRMMVVCHLRPESPCKNLLAYTNSHLSQDHSSQQ